VRKAEAYANAVKYLFRAAARRSELTVRGAPVLSKEDQGYWFLDLIDGLHSLTTVVAYASKGFRPELLEVLQRYGLFVWQLTQKGLDLKKSGPPKEDPCVGLKAFQESSGQGGVADILWEAAKTI
jgi:hypothetical protein